MIIDASKLATAKYFPQFENERQRMARDWSPLIVVRSSTSEASENLFTANLRKYLRVSISISSPCGLRRSWLKIGVFLLSLNFYLKPFPCDPKQQTILDEKYLRSAREF